MSYWVEAVQEVGGPEPAGHGTTPTRYPKTLGYAISISLAGDP